MPERSTEGPIRLARNFTMPLSAVTETFAIIGNRGAGKSATVTTFVEQLHKADQQVVVLDVKGDYWGIRSSRDGRSAGLPFVIFGGDHGDVPLEPTAGAVIADAIVDYRLSAVIDLSLMSKTKQRSFTVAFAERLYMRNRDPLMLIVEEADVLIPQRADAETARLLGAMEDIGKRGRHRGLGLTVATQRGQEVAKSVLDLMETVILLRITGTRTIKAVRDWVSVNADEDSTSARDVIGSLPSMDVGEAWVWSPAFLRTIKRIKVTLFSTFDSHKTPEPGEKRVAPTRRATIDLDKLGAEIAATVERAKATDPKELRAKLARAEQTVQEQAATIADLRWQISEAGEPETVTKIVEVAAPIPDAIRNAVAEIADTTSESLTLAEKARGQARTLLIDMDEHDAQVLDDPQRREVTTKSSSSASSSTRPTSRPAARPAASAPKTAAAPAATVGSGEADPGLGKAERAVLSALAPYAPNPRSAKQVALISQYSSKGGGFRNSLGALRSKGYIVGQNAAMTITDDGLSALGAYEPLPTGSALVEHWCSSSVLGKAEVGALRAIVAAYPNEIDAATVAAEAGYEAGGGGFRNALGKLRSLELIVGGNKAMLASEELID